MIVQMKKVSLVVLNKERKESLSKLKKAGVMHLETLEGSGEQLAKYKEASNNAVVSLGILSEIKVPKKVAKPDVLTNEEIEAECVKIIELSDRKKKLLEEITNDSIELERFSAWGDVDPEQFKYLDGKNVNLRMFEIPEAKYSELDDTVTTVKLNCEKKIVRFLLVNAGTERPETLPPEAYEVPLPENSTSVIRKRISDDENEIADIEKQLKAKALYSSQIEEYKKSLESDILFENVYSGMGKEEDGKTTDLAWLSGFIPVDAIEDFKTVCSENSWAYVITDPTDEDNVPTKLKNNKLVSLVYPLTDFLGTVPGYHEFDISGWFLLFFTIFFGMIFGDGGYGLLVTFVSLLLIIKNKASKKPFNPLFGLMLLLSLATVAWGAVTCTWFGIEPQNLPEWLQKLSIPYISSAFAKTLDATGNQVDFLWKPFWVPADADYGLTKDQNLQIFCFGLALIQLSIAHIKATKRNFKEGNGFKALGDIGSLLQLVGMLWIVLSMVVNSKVFPMMAVINGIPVGKIEISFIGIGFVLSFVFANYEGNLVQSILASCKNIISVLLGVVNVFSDIVSYIRLWAVGLAGAAISNTVNTLAGPILGHAILFFAAVILLVFGHGLNMILNLLSVIVHGVRLNTLEFSQHLGVSWSGTKYQPFSEK